MVYRVLADITLTLHLAFVLFVVFGGLLALRWPRVAWVHIPTAIYGVLIEFIGWTCPLTPIENHFRRLGGEAGYTESFIERYFVSLIYPGGLTRAGFMLLGLLALLINAVIYAFVYRRARRAPSP